MTSAAANPSIAFGKAGRGEPALLMLPGWCGPRTMFDGLLSRTARHRATLAIDWRGHGETPSGAGDFGTEELVADAADVIERAGITRVVPVAAAHAGWVAIELRRRLGPERVPAIVLLDWMVLGTPPGFTDALAGLQDPDRWQQVRDSLVALWTSGVDNPDVLAYVDVMAGYDSAMWARAGREIAAGFAARHTPLAALEPLGCPTLHLYAQPADEEFLAAQRDYAATHPWFRAQRLQARSHFPSLEAPDSVAAAIETFLREVDAPATSGAQTAALVVSTTRNRDGSGASSPDPATYPSHTGTRPRADGRNGGD